MKKISILIAMLATLTACAQVETKTPPKVGMANPASMFCTQQSGQLEMRKTEQGEVGYCHLPSGEIVEEWAYFHSQQAKCQSDAAQSLVGKSSLSEAEIKKHTQANITRVVEPNQPVTMDYREDRVTIVIDPATKAILRASCG